MAQEQLVKHGLEVHHQEKLQAGGLGLSMLLSWLISAGANAPQIIAIVKMILAAFQNQVPAPANSPVAAEALVKLGLKTASVDALAAQGLDLSSLLNMIQQIIQAAPQIIAVIEAILAALQKVPPAPVPTTVG